MIYRLFCCICFCFFVGLCQAEEKAKVMINSPIYTEPFADASKKGSVSRGDTVSVSEKKSGWIKITTSSKQQGWVKATSVRSQANSQLPTSQLASKDTGRATAGNRVITTAVRKPMLNNPNRYLVVVSPPEQMASIKSNLPQIARAWGADPQRNSLLLSNDSTGHSFHPAFTQIAKNDQNEFLLYFTSPLTQQADCEFVFANTDQDISNWLLPIAEKLKNIQHVWIWIDQVNYHKKCDASLNHLGQYFDPQKTQILTRVSQENLPTSIDTPILACQKSPAIDTNQSGLIMFEELEKCLKTPPQNQQNWELWGTKNFTPYQNLNLSGKPDPLLKKIPSLNSLVGELHQVSSHQTSYNNNVIRGQQAVAGFVYVWGITPKNELVLLFPNVSDSANFLEAKTPFEWQVPTSVPEMAQIFVSWNTEPIPLDFVIAEQKNDYFYIHPSLENINKWISYLLTNQQELTKLK
jgi:hypothetical protein